MKLVAIEFRRFWARRVVRLTIVGVALAMTVAGIITFAVHSPEKPSDSALSEQVEADLGFCREMSSDEWRAWDALGRESDYQGGFGEYLAEFETAEEYADEACQAQFYGVFVEDPRYCLVNLWAENSTYRSACPDIDGESYGQSTYSITVDGEQLRTPDSGESGVVPAASIALLGVAAILGAAFIGAEYRAGTIETTLLWEPRRARVLAAKLLAGALSVFVVHVALLGFLVAVLAPAGIWRGSTAGVDAEFWRGLAGAVVRGGLGAAIMALLAMCVAVITKHTAAGVAVLLGYTAVSPALVNMLLRSLRPRDLPENLFALVNGAEVGRWVIVGGYYESVVSHGPGVALAHVVAYTAVLVLVAGAVFVHRDVD